jgi:cation:H+ antiporter
MSAETVAQVAELRILLFILTLVAFVIYIARKNLGKMSAFLLLFIYLVFTLYILGRSVDAEVTNQIQSILNSINIYVDTLRFWK